MNKINYFKRLSVLIALIALVGISSCSSKKKIQKLENKYQTAFETNTNYSASYHEGISYYARLAKDFDQIEMNSFGMTDSGQPLHEVIISSDKDFDPISIKSKGKTILYINNAIHPGEPCGVDASMMLARDLMIDPNKQELLKNVVVVIIPFYILVVRIIEAHIVGPIK